MVADAALYNAKNINSLSGIKWLSRVPMTIGVAKELVSTLLLPDFISNIKHSNAVNGDLDF